MAATPTRPMTAAMLACCAEAAPVYLAAQTALVVVAPTGAQTADVADEAGAQTLAGVVVVV